MYDRDFKSLRHKADNFKIIKIGQKLTTGYFPDIVMQNGNEFIIMECDTGTSRKGYIGGMIKAAKFLTQEKEGIFIYVIKNKDNTKVVQIHAHIEPYFQWISSLTNLKAIYLIDIEDYCTDRPLKLFNKKFLAKARNIQKISK